MKVFGFFFLLGVGLLARADDTDAPLIGNGDFSDGISQWSGDLRLTSDFTPDQVPAVNGAVIKLHSSEWTYAAHDVELKPGVYKLHVTLAIVADTHFSDQIPDYLNVASKLHFNTDNYVLVLHPGQWLMAVTDPTDNKSLTWTVTPKKTTGYQSYTFTIQGIDFNNRQSVLLAFPPGNGYVILQKVFAVADQPAAAPQL